MRGNAKTMACEIYGRGGMGSDLMMMSINQFKSNKMAWEFESKKFKLLEILKFQNPVKLLINPRTSNEKLNERISSARPLTTSPFNLHFGNSPRDIR